MQQGNDSEQIFCWEIEGWLPNGKGFIPLFFVRHVQRPSGAQGRWRGLIRTGFGLRPSACNASPFDRERIWKKWHETCQKGFVAYAKLRHTRKHNSINGGLRFAAPRHQQPEEGVDKTVVDKTCKNKSVNVCLRFSARCQRQPVINMMRAKTKQRKMHFGRTVTFHRHCSL